MTESLDYRSVFRKCPKLNSVLTRFEVITSGFTREFDPVLRASLPFQSLSRDENETRILSLSDIIAVPLSMETKILVTWDIFTSQKTGRIKRNLCWTHVIFRSGRVVFSVKFWLRRTFSRCCIVILYWGMLSATAVCGNSRIWWLVVKQLFVLTAVDSCFFHNSRSCRLSFFPPRCYSCCYISRRSCQSSCWLTAVRFLPADVLLRHLLAEIVTATYEIHQLLALTADSCIRNDMSCWLLIFFDSSCSSP